MFGLGKKTIALAMAAAVIVSGFAFPSAKTVKAEDPEPTVKVLGATLRTDGNTVGTQSLRVGIEVSNASYASNCGIKIKIKDSASDYKVVSTADEKYQKIYSKDAAEDKIVYSVVVENIPVDYASSEIEFIGFVNKLETPTEIYAQTDAVAKSVSGVVQSISDSLGQDVILLDSGDYAGTLVYEYARLDMSAEHSNLEMPDKEGDYSSGAFVVGKNDARAECEYVVSGDDAPYYKVITPAAGDGTENTQGKGIGYIHPSMATTDSYIYSAEVKADTGIAINLVPYWGWNTWKEAGHEGKAVNCNGEWTKFEVKTSNQETWDASNYFSTAGDGGKEYCIKNVVIYKVFSDSDMPEIAAPPTGWNEDHTEYSIKLDDASIWVNSNVTYSINQDGSVNFKVSGEDFGEFGFRIPESVYTTNRFTEAVIAYANNQMACGNHAIKYGTSNPAWGSGASSDDARYQGILSIGSGEASITPNHDVAFNQEYNNNFSAFRFFSIPVGNEITIKSITLKGLVETAQPAETPESYAIEGEALQNSYQGENGGPSSAEYDSADNVMNFSFTGYTGVIYSISDNTIDTSVYKYAQVTYTSSGGSLDVYACQADGTYPDNAAASLTATDTEKIVTVSGFGKGAIKLFHWGYNDDTNITIKSIKFYQNNPETVSED